MPADRSNIINMLRRQHLFRTLEEPLLEVAAGLMEAVDVPAGQVIYSEDDEPNYFYFIVEGQVHLTRSRTVLGHAFPASTLEEDDYFGEEILENAWPRQMTAEAVTDLTLARLDVPRFLALLEAIPRLAKRLQLILDSYRVRLKTPLDWLNDDETVYFIARKHIVFLLLAILPPILAGGFILLLLGLWYLSSPMLTTLILLEIAAPLALAWFVWNYIDWTNDYYIITSQRIAYQERVVLIYDSRSESPLEAIQSTALTTSQWGRWLGYGNVAIRTYIGTILFRNLGDPEQVQAMVQEQQLRASYRESRTENKRIKVMIDKRIREGPEQPFLPRQRKPPSPPDPMRIFLATMFHLRYESGGTVIFRTHWFILLTKIFFPSLFLLGFFVLFVASAIDRFTLLSLQATCGVLFLFGLGAFGWWLYQYIDWHNDIYLITPDQVVDVNKKPLGHEERQAAQLKNILSIEYKRIGILGLLLNFGTVFIRVGDQTLTFDNVLNPAEVQRELFHRLNKRNYEERIKQADTDRRRIADWIAVYNEWQRENPSTSPPPPPRRQGF